ncbi:hypothetical protein J4218_03295 [Candidatus Pacearchaeota archaeon]|nr:hypothetical protein [Candidatus Pacearchaeota archaeon]
MGIFDFFRKKPQEQSKIEFANLESFISGKNKEFSKNSELILEQIKQRTYSLISNLNQDKITLENISIEHKKAEDKLKQIVIDNLKKYIINLNNLTEKLKTIDYSEYTKTTEHINFTLNDFKKRSMMHYEKATILIGDELGKVNDSISDFSKDVNNIIKENQEKIKYHKNINEIEKEYNSFKSTDLLIKDSENQISEIKNRISSKEKEINEYENTISKIKKSKVFNEELKEKGNIYQLKIENDNDINELKSKIDFKKLSQLFHSDNKKMNTINELREHFKENILQNKEKIESLLRESDTKVQDYESSIKKIESNILTIKKKEESLITKSSDEIKDLENKMHRNKNEISYLNQDIEKEEKKKIRFNELKKSTIDKIKAILISMNIELVQ